MSEKIIDFVYRERKGEKMLRSCRFCGKIHDSRYQCDKRPRREKKDTDAVRLRSTYRWQRVRDRVRERDRNVCQVCERRYANDKAADRGGRRYEYEDISVHHIVPIEENKDFAFDENYLITLCGRCHEEAEQGLIDRDFLLEIVRENEAKRKNIPGVV